MEVKKSPKADLNNSRMLFAEIGFVVALLVVWGAFEFKQSEKKGKTVFPVAFFAVRRVASAYAGRIEKGFDVYCEKGSLVRYAFSAKNSAIVVSDSSV